MKLTNTEKEVLAVALDHMEENLEGLIAESDFPFPLSGLQEKLEACKNLQIKLL
tara:strand:- start:97 stop:258 length:162 start_codon:yes stop_codon:yes gene_type:complete